MHAIRQRLLHDDMNLDESQLLQLILVYDTGNEEQLRL